MFGSNTIRDISVTSNNNQVSNSGNTTTNSHNSNFISGNNIQNATFIASTGANEAQYRIREGFEEFKVPVKLAFPQNPNFCGREDILERMRRTLDLCPPNNRGSNPGRKSVVLYGMGGVGKSQIALEYANRFSHYYTSIFWIDADDISLTTESAFQAMERLKDHNATKWCSSPDF